MVAEPFPVIVPVPARPFSKRPFVAAFRRITISPDVRRNRGLGNKFTIVNPEEGTGGFVTCNTTDPFPGTHSPSTRGGEGASYLTITHRVAGNDHNKYETLTVNSTREPSANRAGESHVNTGPERIWTVSDHTTFPSLISRQVTSHNTVPEVPEATAVNVKRFAAISVPSNGGAVIWTVGRATTWNWTVSDHGPSLAGSCAHVRTCH